jgi:hypothetical protein
VRGCATEDNHIDDIKLHPDAPGHWGPFKATGADAWRAEGELAGRRMFIKVFAACGVSPGRTDWCWEIAEAKDGDWVLRATGAERCREAVVSEVEEALWGIEEREERRRNEDRRAAPQAP